LTRCAAFIAPQARGLAPLPACPNWRAGIPTFVSAHASYALDLPPGAVALPGLADWRAALEQPAAAPTAADSCRLGGAASPTSLGAIVRQLAVSRA
jgi:hypothetical protein